MTTPPTDLHMNAYRHSLFDFALVPPGKKEWDGIHSRSEIGFNFSDVIADWSIDGSRTSRKHAPRDSVVYYPRGIQHSVTAENHRSRLKFTWSGAYIKSMMVDANQLEVLSEFRDYHSDPVLITLARNVTAILADPGPFVDLQMDGYAHAILGRFLHIHAGALPNIAPGHSHPPISRAIDYAMENLQTSLTINVLAEKAGLSPWHFSRVFKALVGDTPHRWVMKQRFNKAFNLLRFSKLSLGEITFECGFASPSHLSNTVKKISGKTPRQIRNE
ncbi:helix-turn-helix domain-containing protein [Parasphingorhabdus cellanae]|uniref:Helix-turn-helix transcriptional regulator n=1 Tax=Parasphingorhabdus cellanae TaxID=2806553 RepID=A0ABX7T104_9SPHN|nr:AraC family transcriptional regulator [Parasphingorhabdus cellanae]QTD54442.1 helix-turn-helix transcriptional regulator [Parasphingorhabdus cellanae]